MDEKLAYWGSVILSAIALILIVINISLSNSNRLVQQDVTQRQALLAGGQQVSQFNQSLVQIMAEAAYKNNNAPLRDLLTSQGITLKSETPPNPSGKISDKPSTKK